MENLNLEYNKRILVKAALRQNKYKKDAAKALGICGKTLKELINEYNL